MTIIFIYLLGMVYTFSYVYMNEPKSIGMGGVKITSQAVYASLCALVFPVFWGVELGSRK